MTSWQLLLERPSTRLDGLRFLSRDTGSIGEEMKISSRVASLPASGIRKVFDEAERLEREGHHLIRFDVGRPDLATPTFVVDAAHAALDEGWTKYVENRGIPELREAIAARLERDRGVAYDPATEVIVTTGASEAVAASLTAVLEPGSEILVPTPAWPHYANVARLVGAEVVEVPLDLDKGMQLDAEDLAPHISERTRLLVVNSPSNPTSVVTDPSRLEGILALAREHDLWVMSDEIYETYCFGGSVSPSFASLPDARERTLTINGFSKAFGMTGWRVGYVAAPAGICAEINKPHQYTTVCATAFAQKAAVAAYSHSDSTSFLEQVRSDFESRRDCLLAAVGGRLSSPPPDGAFYFFPRLPASAPDAAEATLHLLREAKVAVVPGSVFGRDFGRHIRVSYGSCSIEDIETGVRRILDVCSSW